MRMRTLITGFILSAFCVLSTPAALGQEQMTKSGTWVAPADRRAVTPMLQQKSSSPLPDPTAGTYLVVTQEELLSALEPMLEWKRQQGYRVETLMVTTSESDSIRAALQRRYDQSTLLRPAQRYVLLVGDVDRLQSTWGRYTPGGLENSVTDLYYGEYTGDYLPEAMVGRISVTDSAELAAVVRKTIEYEQGRWAAAERVLLTAGYEERSNAETTTNGQVRYLGNLVAEYRPNLDTICFYNPDSRNQLDTIVRALDRAHALINYTAHCTSQGWNIPAVNHTTVDTLEGDVPTVWVNNCCRSNAFNTSCFGEQLLRIAAGGAAAVIGATNETLWNEDYYWAVGAKYPPTDNPCYDSSRPGAFDRMLTGEDEMGGVSGMNGTAGGKGVPGRYDADAVSLGAMNYAGCSAVTLAGSPYDAFYWETYCLLGDPSMSLMLGTQDTLLLSVIGATDSIAAGTTEMGVWSSPWSRVSATQAGVLLGTTLTNEDGHGIIYLDHGLTGDSLIVTATRPESIYRQRVLPIASPAAGRLAITAASINNVDDHLELRLQNVGQTAAINHHLSFTQDSADAARGAQLNTSGMTMTVDSLASGAEMLVRWPIEISSIGSLPLLLGQLTLSYDTADYASLHLALDMADMRPRLSSWELLDEMGVHVRKIEDGKQYTLSASLTHEADTARLWLNDSLAATGTECDQVACTFLTDEDTDRLHIALEIDKDRWHIDYNGWLLAYNNMEDFESGDWSNYPWQTTNLYPWQIDSSAAHSGTYCARSATIGNSQRSTMTLEITTLTDDSVTFYYNVSSEGSDWLYFFVDGRRWGYWSGNSGWQRYAHLLTAGRHTLQWIYQKDASNSQHEDCARIDDIRLPLALWDNPYGHSVRDSVGVDISNSTLRADDFAVWPNPADGKVTIAHPVRPYTRLLHVYDAYGRQVDAIKIADNCETTQYLTHHLRLGIYTLVLNDKERRLVRKLIVTK